PRSTARSRILMSSMPARFSSIAAAMPPNPAPTMITDGDRAARACSLADTASDIPLSSWIVPSPAFSTLPPAGVARPPQLRRPARLRAPQPLARHEAVREQQQRLVGRRAKAALRVRRVDRALEPSGVLPDLEADELRAKAVPQQTRGSAARPQRGGRERDAGIRRRADA